MSTARAVHYVRRMAELETRGFGDDDNALRRLEAFLGVSFWTLKYLKQGKATNVAADLLERIRGGYLTYCENKIGALQSTLAAEREIEPDDVALFDLEFEAAQLAAKIAKAKAARLKRWGRP